MEKVKPVEMRLMGHVAVKVNFAKLFLSLDFFVYLCILLLCDLLLVAM